VTPYTILIMTEAPGSLKVAMDHIVEAKEIRERLPRQIAEETR